MTVKSQSKTVVLPKRSEVPVADQWDLTPLAASDAAWEKDFKKWEKQIEKYAQFKGKLAKSVRNVAELLRFDADFNRLMERVCRYAFLKTAGDLGDSVYQRMLGRARHVMVKAAEASSYMRPELLAIPVAKMKKFMNSPVLAEWKLDLERIVRHRPHTLSNAEEQLLAMTGQMAAGANHVFQQLTGADLKWPTMKDEKGVLVELDHSSFAKFLWSPKRAVRKEAFHLYNGQFDAHKNTIAATYNTSVQQDVFYAKVRKHKSALEASLFQDNVPVKVYDALVAAVHKYRPVNHRYLALRGKVLGIKDGKGGGVRMYDTYVPMVAGAKKHHTWDEAVKVVVEAMGPLGTEYCGVLAEGLGAARWADRYPNKGKNPGA
ncbi:MAG: M3 family metallopeptidase, partial [Phycisphaerales bacterium]|nr:M3 family metallopeptidase [Phycisphaerales bacterium]